eukprot:TRINITY_DN535_c0_g1_i1.p1 TRINITY_DN535_c0_g1~~TRINITY_DN535_c0_g1_i1.p1  ORF type:complete len:685 (+),score=278.47 TRINITY_DN535_c0_g1_i1:69-2123(+)
MRLRVRAGLLPGCPLIWLLLGALSMFQVGGETLRGRANPIRKVVNLLKKMDAKVEKEGEKAEEMFEKYMCYCKKTSEQLEAQIAAASQKIPLVQSELKEAKASHTQLEEDLKTHKKDREEAKKAVSTSTEIRQKAAEAFATDSTNMKANLKALGQAVTAISKGMGNSFLQTSTASVLQRLSLSMDMSADDREMLAAFLTSGGTTSEGYEPQSGEIVGILKQMGDEMSKDLAEMTTNEEREKQQYAALIAAKQKEIAAATKDVELKTGRVGELAVQIAELKDDLEDTQEALAEDQAFLANLKKSCENKKVQYEQYKKMMAEERVALAETIKILNDDDALELFKKTLPSPSALQEDSSETSALSFLQTAKQRKDRRRQAAAKLKNSHGDHRLSLLVLAMKGQKAGFEAIMAKVDELVGILGQEQSDDDNKRVFCNTEIDKTEDELKADKRAVQDRQAVIGELEDSMGAVVAEIQGLVEGIKKLDEEVKEQTELRKQKNSENLQTLASNNAALQLLELAKNRLQKFYNPKLYKKPPAEALDQEDQMPAPPEADFSMKKGESGGVLQMLDMLREDVNKEITQLKMQEQEAQKDYEQFLKDSSNKRMIDSKAVSDKEGVKAELEEKLNIEREGLRGDQTELKQTQQELLGLHRECDWLLQNYDLRKTARAQEVDSLQKAKAVLSGANFS